MSRIRCDVCVGTGEVFSDTEKVWGKCWVCDGLGELDDTPADDYYEDEWYDDEDWDSRVDETSYSWQLYKAKNGQLSVIQTFGYKYSGQDWGETVGQWEQEHIRLKHLSEFVRRAAIHIGKRMKRGQCIDFYWGSVRLVRPVRLRPWFYALHLEHMDIPV